MGFQRVTHADPWDDGSATDGTVIINALEAALEAVQAVVTALGLSHDGTNGHIQPTSGYVGIQSNKFQVLPTGAVNYVGPTSASAATGSNGAPPAQVQGYLTWQVGGTTVHIPYYL